MCGVRLVLIFLTVLGLGVVFGDGVRLADPGLTEASGMAVSRRDGDFLWLLNDSGGAAELRLAMRDGAARGAVKVSGVRNVDWEDLAGFTVDGVGYLLIADTGDNESKRESVRLHLVREPALPKVGEVLAGEVKPEWSMEFKYEDGPRDCEGVGFDPVGRRVLLISKRTQPPVVYELEFRRPKEGEVLTAKRLGPLAKLERAKGSMPRMFSGQPTGLDISSDGRKAAVLTYTGVYFFQRGEGEGWGDAFARVPVLLGEHKLPQAEAVAFGVDGGRVWATSERARPALIGYEVPR